MVEVRHRQETPHSPTSRSRQMMKAATAATAGGSFLVMSGLMLTGTIIALAMATPFLLIFSPVVVPAVVTVLLLATGFLAAGGFVLAAVAVLSWMYKYAKQGGAESMDKNKARAMAKAASDNL